jgi:hypothetical protein
VGNRALKVIFIDRVNCEESGSAGSHQLCVFSTDFAELDGTRYILAEIGD